MVPKKNRLNSVQFNTVFKSGKKKYGSDFMVIHTPGEETRVAVTISKKKAKRAVERTLVRRRVYEHIRKNYLPKMSGSYIVMVKSKEYDLEELNTLLP